MTNDGIKPIGGLKEARPTNNLGEKNHRGNREGTYILTEHALMIVKPKGAMKDTTIMTSRAILHEIAAIIKEQSKIM